MKKEYKNEDIVGTHIKLRDVIDNNPLVTSNEDGELFIQQKTLSLDKKHTLPLEKYKEGIKLLEEPWETKMRTFILREFNAIHENERSERFDHLDTIISSLREEFEDGSHIVAPPLPMPDPTGNNYPLFPGIKNADMYEWLKEHWGKWLKHFTPELDQNILFLNDLRKMDTKLVGALNNHREIFEKKYGASIEEVVPRIWKKKEIELENISPEMLRHYANLNQLHLSKMKNEKKS